MLLELELELLWPREPMPAPLDEFVLLPVLELVPVESLGSVVVPGVVVLCEEYCVLWDEDSVV